MVGLHSPDPINSEKIALQLTPNNLESTLFKIPNEGEYFFGVNEIKLTEGEELPTEEEFRQAREYMEKVLSEKDSLFVEVIGGVAWSLIDSEYRDPFLLEKFFGALVLLNPYFASMIQRSKVCGTHYDKSRLINNINISSITDSYVRQFLIYENIEEDKLDKILDHGGLLSVLFDYNIDGLDHVKINKLTDFQVISILTEIVTWYKWKSLKVDGLKFDSYFITKVLKLRINDGKVSDLITKFLDFDSVKKDILENDELSDLHNAYNIFITSDSVKTIIDEKLIETTGNSDIDLFLLTFEDKFKPSDKWGYLYLDRAYFNEFFENPKRDEIFAYLLENKRDWALAILRTKVSHTKLEKLIKNLDNETIQKLLKDGIVIPEFFTRTLQNGDLMLRNEFMEQDQFSIVKAITLLPYDKQYEIIRNLGVNELTNLFLIIYFLSNEKYYSIKAARHVCKRFKKFELLKVLEALDKAEEIKPGIKEAFGKENILAKDLNKKEKISAKSLERYNSLDFIKSLDRFNGHTDKGLYHDLSDISQIISTLKEISKKNHYDLSLTFSNIFDDFLKARKDKSILNINFLLNTLERLNFTQKIINEIDENLEENIDRLLLIWNRLIGDYILFSRKPVNLKTLNSGNGGKVRGQLVYIEEADYEKVQLIFMDLKPNQIPVLHDYPTTYSQIIKNPVAVISRTNSEYSHSSFFCDRNKIPLLHLGSIEVLESLNGVEVEINSDTGELKIIESDLYTLPSPDITESIGTKTKGLEQSSLSNFYIGSEFYYGFLNTFYINKSFSKNGEPSFIDEDNEEVFYPYDYIKGLFDDFKEWDNTKELENLSKAVQEFINFIALLDGKSKKFTLQKLKKQMQKLGITYPISLRSDGRLEDINGERTPGVKTSYLNIRNDDELWGTFINMIKNEFSIGELLNKYKKGINPVFSTFGANLQKMLISEENEAINIFSGVAVFKDGVWKVQVCIGLNAGITSGKIKTLDLQKNSRIQDFTQENYITIDNENGGLKTVRNPKLINVNSDINELIYSKLESLDGVESVEFSIRNFKGENPEFVILQLN